MPNLAAVETIASDTPTRTVTLSGLSVTVLFSCLDAANRLYDWIGAGPELTPAEIDEIYAFLAAARTELMVSQLGEIKAFASAIIPLGCLLCDGGTYNRVDYPDLYAVLAPAFIVDADTFTVPDLRARFVLGAASSINIGDIGGEANHTLDISEIPSHTHTIPETITTLVVEPGEVTALTPIPLLTQNTGATGGDGAHNNMPPYMELAYYIIAR